MHTVTFKDQSIIELNRFTEPTNKQYSFYYRQSTGYKTISKWKRINTSLSHITDILNEIRNFNTVEEFKDWNYEKINFSG